MERACDLPRSVQLILLFHESYLFQFIDKFVDDLVQFELFRIEMHRLFFQFHVGRYLFEDIRCPERKPGAEHIIESFKEIQAVNPTYKPVKLGIKLDTAFLSGEIVVAVPAFKIESDPGIILPVLFIIVLYGIIDRLSLAPYTVGADESSPTQDVKYFFCVFHAG